LTFGPIVTWFTCLNHTVLEADRRCRSRHRELSKNTTLAHINSAAIESLCQRFFASVFPADQYWRRSLFGVCAYSSLSTGRIRLIALATFTKEYRHLVFDTDSYLLALDNCASRCMSSDLNDFVGPMVDVQEDLHGIGKVTACKQGTLKWSFEDDNGIVHSFLIPDSYYVPDLPVRLLSPQHWSQTNPRRGAHSDTNGERITMEWDNTIRTIPLNAANVGFMRSAPGYSTSQPVITALNALLPEELYCFPAHLIPPDDEDGAQDERPRATPVTTGAAADNTPTGTATSDAAEHEPPVPVEFDLDDLPPIDDEMMAQVDRHSQDLPARLLHWHYRMGHLSFKKLQVMAEQGTIPKALAPARYHSARLASTVKPPREHGALARLPIVWHWPLSQVLETAFPLINSNRLPRD
jgi:hypothetical protein